MISMTRRFVEGWIGGFLFFFTTSELEDYTGIDDRYPTMWFVAKFIAYFTLFYLYSRYRDAHQQALSRLGSV